MHPRVQLFQLEQKLEQMLRTFLDYHLKPIMHDELSYITVVQRLIPILPP